MKVKVCGMKDRENIEDLLKLSPDFIGFIFYEKSPRFIGTNPFDGFEEITWGNTKKVGVFVNATADKIQSVANSFSLDLIQLHGDESPSDVSKIKSVVNKPVLKAFGVGESFDFFKLKDYDEICDYFLFDTKSKKYGGTGVTFDWQLLKGYDLPTPIFLSGGIGNEHIDELKQTINALPIYAIDVNSKFEISPAMKDIEALNQFIPAAKGL